MKTNATIDDKLKLILPQCGPLGDPHANEPSAGQSSPQQKPNDGLVTDDPQRTCRIGSKPSRSQPSDNLVVVPVFFFQNRFFFFFPKLGVFSPKHNKEGGRDGGGRKQLNQALKGRNKETKRKPSGKRG